MRRPLVVAHRGDSRHHPENTLPAIASALAMGADVIELDVHRSADGVAFIMHDRDLQRTTGQTGLVDALSAAEIDRRDAGNWRGPGHAGAKVPRLAEAVAATEKSGARLCLEFKHGAYREAEDAARWLVEQIARHALRSRAVVNLGSAEIARQVHRLDPAIRIALDCEQQATGAQAVELATRIAATGASLVELEQNAVTRDMVLACHRAGLGIWAWTANDAADWDRLCAAGVDAILTDDPAGLIAHLARMPGT